MSSPMRPPASHLAWVCAAGFFICGDPMKDTLKRLAKNRLTWIVFGSLLAAAGVTLPPEVREALPVIGTLLIE